MTPALLLAILSLASAPLLLAQNPWPDERQRRDISALIDQYSQARDKKDTVLLKQILTDDIDQLVSSGEWRTGIRSAVQGMLSSSASAPGKRTLDIEKMRLLDSHTAIVDCRYEIQTANGPTRRMWSTFLVVSAKGVWKISAIRNMLPSGQ